MFESLWDENGVWEIGAPLHSIATGAPKIAAHMIELAEPLEFFVQQVHSGVVVIDGNQATARWSVQETGRSRTHGPYNNHAFYEDELMKRTEHGVSRGACTNMSGLTSSRRLAAKL
jgi:hypothetical protein